MKRGIFMNNQLLKGPVTRSLLLFSLPMILGNLLQQLYNVADTFIVGHFLGSNALAAVGSSFTLMTFLTSIILGLCMGSGVLFSMLYGSQEYGKMKNSFFISFISIALLTIVLQLACLIFIDNILVFLRFHKISSKQQKTISSLFFLVFSLLFFIITFHQCFVQ